MHFKRWVTALVALPFLLLLIFKGGSLSFFIAVCLVSTLALGEYFGIVFYSQKEIFKNGAASCGHPQKSRFEGLLSLKIMACISGFFLLGCAFLELIVPMICVIALTLIGSAVLSVFRFSSNPLILEGVVQQILGIVYIPMFLSFLVLIRKDPNGAWWIFSFLCIIFSGDTAAFYVGSYLGKHKLCPSISPGKTVEGALGGLVANMGTGAMLKGFFLVESSWGLSILFFFCIGLVGQVGDLFESEIKRSANIKDSGGILPGHGGVLDRIDALLFAAPIAYVFKACLL